MKQKTDFEIDAIDKKKGHETVIFKLNFFFFLLFLRLFRPKNKNQTNYFLVNDFGVFLRSMWPEMLTFPKKKPKAYVCCLRLSPRAINSSVFVVSCFHAHAIMTIQLLALLLFW